VIRFVANVGETRIGLVASGNQAAITKNERITMRRAPMSLAEILADKTFAPSTPSLDAALSEQ
jgi:hypothetical protein